MSAFGVCYALQSGAKADIVGGLNRANSGSPNALKGRGGEPLFEADSPPTIAPGHGLARQ